MQKVERDQGVSCSIEKATVLSMVKAWPGVPAIVTYTPETGWSVGTRAEDAAQHLARQQSPRPSLSKR